VDDAEALELACVERGWRYAWLDGVPYMFDERREYLARVSPAVLDRLSVEVPLGTLGEVLRDLAEGPGTAGETQGASASGASAIVRLRLLGVRIDVRCAYQECAEEIASFYSASHVTEQSSSPEVIVWCESEHADRYLFRSRPDDEAGTPLAGVFVQTLRSPRQPWTATLPPIPALASWPFKDRFVALHAAAVRAQDGTCFLIAGDRGSGKTTAALSLADRLGVAVLCDETAFVHCRTAVVEPFPHAVGIWRDDRKVRVPITEVCPTIGSDPALISHLVFLQRREGQAARVSRLPKARALRFLLDQHRDGGAPIGDAIQTVMHLADQCEASLIDYSATEELVDALCGLIGDPSPKT
jgi:hypothetical protein